MNRAEKRRRQKQEKKAARKQGQREGSGSEVQGLLQKAVPLHQAGRLEDAVAIYRRILAAEPDHADAAHLLGVIAHQVGDHGAAVELIGTAIRHDPTVAAYHCNLGNALHQLGRLNEAAASQRRAIALKDDYAKALGNLGNVLLAQERPDDAVASYQKALSIAPDDAEIHTNLGTALYAQGHMDQAETSYRKALALNPNYAEAHTSLGNTLQEAGRLEDAAASHRQALSINPDYAEAHANLGNALKDMDRLEDAAASYRKAIALDPDLSGAHTNLGLAQKELGRLEDAAASYRKAIALDPDNPEARLHLGDILNRQGRWEEAATSYRKALALAPDNPGALTNLGDILTSLDRLEDAAASHRQALSINPDYAEAHANLGNVLKNMGLLEDAAASYRKAIALDPDLSGAHTNLGNVLQKQGLFEDAIASHRKALAIQPDLAEAHKNLGSALMDLDRLEDAVASYHKALAIKPDFDTAMTDLLYQLRHACAWPDIDELEPKVREFTKQSIREGGKVAILPFANITASADASGNFAVAQARSSAIAKKVSGLKTDFQMSGLRPLKPRITIGYLSNDFHNHATAHLMLSLFGLHDREDFSIFTLSCGPNDESAYRKKIKNDSDKFFDLQAVSHLEAAGKIFESGVDILVDLKGHTLNNRLEICALRPAPVQVAYLGFPGTTGADFMDYIITDKTVTPEDQSPYYSEQFVYLPHCYQVNDIKQKISDVPFTKSDFGLPEKGFIFCSFNRNYKIEPVMFGVWMNLLKKTPDSVLWLFRDNDLAERNLKSEAKARGVDGDRLIFAGHIPKDRHLARCRLADLALDTRIYGGHTTTSDFLWAGVPVVTMLGAHFASRVSASLLNAVGLPELITHNLEDYEALTFRLAQNPDELDGLTAKLARNRLSEPLFDTPRFVSNLENAYRRMWDNYLSGEQPSRIDVIEG